MSFATRKRVAGLRERQGSRSQLESGWTRQAVSVSAVRAGRKKKKRKRGKRRKREARICSHKDTPRMRSAWFEPVRNWLAHQFASVQPVYSWRCKSTAVRGLPKNFEPQLPALAPRFVITPVESLDEALAMAPSIVRHSRARVVCIFAVYRIDMLENVA